MFLSPEAPLAHRSCIVENIPDHETRSRQVRSHQNNVGELGLDSLFKRPRSIHLLGRVVTFAVL